MDVALVEAAAGDGALEREARRVVSLEERSLAEAISVLAYAELAALGRRYGPVGRDETRRLFAGHDSRESRLPLVPVFYEGYRNNYEHAAPACAHAGLVG